MSNLRWSIGPPTSASRVPSPLPRPSPRTAPRSCPQLLRCRRRRRRRGRRRRRRLTLSPRPPTFLRFRILTSGAPASPYETSAPRPRRLQPRLQVKGERPRTTRGGWGPCSGSAATTTAQRRAEERRSSLRESPTAWRGSAPRSLKTIGTPQRASSTLWLPRIGTSARSG